MKPLYAIPLLLLALILNSCTRLPKEEYWQWVEKSWAKHENDTLVIYLENPLRCPLRFRITSPDATFSAKLKPIKNIMLGFAQDTLIKIPATQKQAQDVLIAHGFGDPTQEIRAVKFTLPFLSGKEYRIIQGYNGSFSHNNAYSKYAIDFNLPLGDTVCAAEDGYVVGVIRNYKEGGTTKKWQNYANFITLYHPHSGLYTQYAHLRQNGSLVDVGDFVRLGDPIGLAGKTGFTNIQHLHFNVLRPDDSAEWLQSCPADYMEGYKGESLRQGDTVKKPPLQ